MALPRQRQRDYPATALNVDRPGDPASFDREADWRSARSLEESEPFRSEEVDIAPDPEDRSAIASVASMLTRHIGAETDPFSVVSAALIQGAHADGLCA